MKNELERIRLRLEEIATSCQQDEAAAYIDDACNALTEAVEVLSETCGSNN